MRSDGAALVVGSGVVLVMALACAGFGAEPEKQGAKPETRASSRPRVEEEPDEPAPPEPVPLGQSVAPDALQALPREVEPPAFDCQPEVFDPAKVELPAEGDEAEVRYPHYVDEMPDASLSWRRIEAADGVELRVFTFSGCDPRVDRQDRVLEVLRDGERTALFTHVDLSPSLSADGRRVLLRNRVAAGDAWERRTRIIDVVGGTARSLPDLACLGTDARFLRDGSIIASEPFDVALGGQIERCRIDAEGTVTAGFRYDPILNAPPAWVLPLSKDPAVELVAWRVTCDVMWVDYRSGATGEIRMTSLAGEPAEYADDFVCQGFAGIQHLVDTATLDTLPEVLTPAGRSPDASSQLVVSTMDLGQDVPVVPKGPSCLHLARDGAGDIESLSKTPLDESWSVSGTILDATCANDGWQAYGVTYELSDGTRDPHGPLAAPPVRNADGTRAAHLSWSAYGKRASQRVVIVDLTTGQTHESNSAHRCQGSRMQWVGDRLFTATTADDLRPRELHHHACVFDEQARVIGHVSFEGGSDEGPDTRVDPLLQDPEHVVVRSNSGCHASLVDLARGTVEPLEHRAENSKGGECRWFKRLDRAIETKRVETFPRSF